MRLGAAASPHVSPRICLPPAVSEAGHDGMHCSAAGAAADASNPILLRLVAVGRLLTHQAMYEEYKGPGMNHELKQKLVCVGVGGRAGWLGVSAKQ